MTDRLVFTDAIDLIGIWYSRYRSGVGAEAFSAIIERAVESIEDNEFDIEETGHDNSPEGIRTAAISFLFYLFTHRSFSKEFRDNNDEHWGIHYFNNPNSRAGYYFYDMYLLKILPGTLDRFDEARGSLFTYICVNLWNNSAKAKKIINEFDKSRIRFELLIDILSSENRSEIDGATVSFVSIDEAFSSDEDGAQGIKIEVQKKAVDDDPEAGPDGLIDRIAYLRYLPVLILSGNPKKVNARRSAMATRALTVGHICRGVEYRDVTGIFKWEKYNLMLDGETENLARECSENAAEIFVRELYESKPPLYFAGGQDDFIEQCSQVLGLRFSASSINHEIKDLKFKWTAALYASSKEIEPLSAEELNLLLNSRLE